MLQRAAMDYKKQVGFTIVELPPSLKFRRASLVPNNNVKQGFTIVELLVVIVVIGILAAITIVSYTGLSSKANVSSLQSDLSSAKKQLALYYIDHSAYPDSIGNDNCPSPADSKYCIKPSSGNTFTYAPTAASNPQSFSLFASKNGTIYSISNNSSPISAYATGGTVTTDGSYRIHTFTTSGTLIVTTPVTADVLVVGGGGGGSGGYHPTNGFAGGGGGGGYVKNYYSVNISPSASIPIVVGNGGTGGYGLQGSGAELGVSGSPSYFLNSSYQANGGGGGAGWSGGNGGSGGGAGNGCDWTVYGGVGGSNGSNGVAPVGGCPATSGTGQGTSTTGINGVLYSGGGGGSGLSSACATDRGGAGGAGGGGRGGTYNGCINGTSALSNTGGGGGGGAASYVANYRGGNGGSGIVIIRYLTP